MNKDKNKKWSIFNFLRIRKNAILPLIGCIFIIVIIMIVANFIAMDRISDPVILHIKR